MEKLWDHAPQTGRELTEAMAAQTGWNRSTTLTLLRRLMEKGAVRCDAQGRKNVFYPAVRREDAAAQQTRDLLGRVYKGSLSMLVSEMTKREALPQREIDELHALLQEMEEKKRHG
jgi:hypothetical protein